MERADAAVGPWSVHLLDIAPELTDADVARLQDEDEVLGPIKHMLSQGYSPTLNDLRALPLEVGSFGPCGPPSSLKIRCWSDGMAMPSSWWCHSLCATSCLHIRMPVPLQPTWVLKECWHSYAVFTIGPACVGTLMPGVGNVKDVPSVGGRLSTSWPPSQGLCRRTNGLGRHRHPVWPTYHP